MRLNRLIEIKDHWKKNTLVDEKEYLSMHKDSVEKNENNLDYFLP